MLGRQDVCVPPNMDEVIKLRYQRDLFNDLKIAIDYLKEFNDKLNNLHPDVCYKIRSII